MSNQTGAGPPNPDTSVGRNGACPSRPTNWRRSGEIAATLAFLSLVLMTLGLVIGARLVRNQAPSTAPHAQTLQPQTQPNQTMTPTFTPQTNSEITFTASGIAPRGASFPDQYILSGSICFANPPSQGTFRITVDEGALGASTQYSVSGQQGKCGEQTIQTNIVFETPDQSNSQNFEPQSAIYGVNVETTQGNWNLSNRLLGNLSFPPIPTATPSPTSSPTPSPSASPTPTSSPTPTPAVPDACWDECSDNPDTQCPDGGDARCGCNPNLACQDMGQREVSRCVFTGADCSVGTGKECWCEYPTPITTETPTPTPTPETTNTPTPAPESLLIPLATYVKNSGEHRITKLKAQICLKDDPNSCAQTASENVPPDKLHPGDVNLWYGIEIPKVNNTDEFQLYMWADFVGDVTPIEQVFPSQFRGFPGNMRALINHGRPVQLWYEGIDAESDQSEFADILQAVDIDNNACINSIDASLIIKNYFEESTEEKQLDEDVNLDGIVNGMDFSYLNAYWGQGDDCAYNSPSLQNFTFE